MLSNYKIRVNNEAESKEAQWLFCVLGGSEHICDRFGIVCLSGGKVYTDRVEFFEDYDDCEELTLPQLRDLVTKSKKEQGLITGADAKLAWAKGEELEFYSPDLDMWFGLNDEPFMSDVFDTRPIRIKPRTILITLSLEIPAPFEPKDGDEVYFIDCDTKRGYSSDIIGQGCDPDWIQFGAWKSEDEVKQVVEALRSTLTSKQYYN